VLAGSREARQAFDRIEPGLRRIMGDLVDDLDGIDDPAQIAQTLADYRPATSSDGPR
jgi:hypothetical protein